MDPLDAQRYPQEDPDRPTHSQDWFDQNPDPGTSQQEWSAHLCTSLTVLRGLVEQIRTMLQREDLHLAGRKLADVPDEIDQKIGIPLSRQRTDVCRPGIPVSHFVATVRRIAIRVSSADRRRESRNTQEGESGSLGTHKRAIKRKRVVELVESDFDPDSDEDFVAVPQGPSHSVSRGRKKKDALPSIPRTSLRNGNSPPLAHLGKSANKPDLKLQDVWIQITLADDDINTFYCQLSDLSDDEVNMDSCLNVQLDKLWQLIRKWEDDVGCAFYERKKHCLIGNLNGKKRNVMAGANFILACRTQLTALRLSSATPAFIEFECIARPESMQPPSPSTRSEPSHPFPPRHVAIPPPWPASPAPATSMISTPNAGVYTSYQPRADTIRAEANFRPAARMHEVQPTAQGSVPSTSITNRSYEGGESYGRRI